MFAPDLINSSFTIILSFNEIPFGRTERVEPPPEIKKGSEVSAEIKESLDSDDPWMQRKKEQENQ